MVLPPFSANFAVRITQQQLMQTNNTERLLSTIIKGIQDKKGQKIVVADLDGIDGAICRYFVICQGGSPIQVQAIAESVGDFARESAGEKPLSVVGLDNAQWVAMDYADVMVHIFLPETRSFYNLEELWEDAGMKEIDDEDNLKN